MTLIIAINSPFDNEALPSLHFTAGKLKEFEGNFGGHRILSTRGSIVRKGGGCVYTLRYERIWKHLDGSIVGARIEDNLIGKLFFYGKRVNAR